MSDTKTMTPDKVHWFLDLFDALDIKVWIDGGWGVDALLGEPTRQHQDLDILISWEDSARLTEALRTHGFVDVPTDDRKDRNFVMGHPSRGLIDFHVVEMCEEGGAVYGGGEIDWVITETELSAIGTIGGRQVRCLSVDYQIRSHTGYTRQEKDYADLRALHERYGVALLPEQTRRE